MKKVSLGSAVLATNDPFDSYRHILFCHSDESRNPDKTFLDAGSSPAWRIGWSRNNKNALAGPLRPSKNDCISKKGKRNGMWNIKMADKPNRFRTIRNVIGIIILLAFVYFGIMPFIIGGDKMKTLCQSITPGMTPDDVHKLIDRGHYKFIENGSGDNHTITIIDSKAMGRFICEVSFDQDKVTEARYVYNDWGS